MNAATIRALAAKGFDAAQIADIADALRPVRNDEHRAKDAARQRRHRANVTPVTDVTGCDARDPSSPPPPSMVSPITPSLTTPTTPPSRSPSARGDAGRGVRLADDWQPTERAFEIATRHGVSREIAMVEGLKFRNYWTAKTGRDATKTPDKGWPRTWENWILNVRGSTNGRKSVGLDESKSTVAAAKRQHEAAERGEFRLAPRPVLLTGDEDSFGPVPERRRG